MHTLHISTAVDGDKQTYQATSYVDAYEYLRAHEPEITWINFQRKTPVGEGRAISGQPKTRMADAIQWLIEAETELFGSSAHFEATIAVREERRRTAEEHRRNEEAERRESRKIAAQHTRKELDAFLEALKSLCEAHDVVLAGTDDSEGSLGGILIGRLSNADAIDWEFHDGEELSGGDGQDWYVEGYFPRPADRRQPGSER